MECLLEWREWAWESSGGSLGSIENPAGSIERQEIFGGQSIGLVDIAANFIGYWVPILQDIARLELLTIEKFPKLYKSSQEFINHHVINEALPPTNELFAFFKASAKN